MRILQLCKKFPFPPRDGETIAIESLNSAFLAQGHSIDLLSLNTLKHHVDLSAVPPVNGMVMHAIDIDTTISYPTLALNFWRAGKYQLHRFWSDDFASKLVDLLRHNTYDIIHFEGLYPLIYFDLCKANSGAKLVQRSHNVESEIWGKLAEFEGSVLKKWLFRQLSLQLKREEIKLTKCCDALVAISEPDRQWFINQGFDKPDITIPTGVKSESKPRFQPKENKHLFFIGGMDWLPNRDAIDWFASTIWPKVQARNPETHCYIAGRNFPTELLAQSTEHLHMLGEVDDAQQFMSKHAIMIVPLRSGSGMRIKIIEGMLAGNAIVSTSLGATGIDYESGKNICIADEADTFADAINELIDSSDMRNRLAENAQALALEKYDHIELGKKLLSFYHELIAK